MNKDLHCPVYVNKVFAMNFCNKKHIINDDFGTKEEYARGKTEFGRLNTNERAVNQLSME